MEKFSNFAENILIMVDYLKLRYEKIGKEDKELLARNYVLKDKMLELAKNFKVFHAQTEELIKAEKRIEKINDSDYDRSLLFLNDMNALYKNFIALMNSLGAHMKANPTIITDVFDFVKVINVLHENVHTHKYTKKHISKLLTNLETELMELKFRFDIYEEESLEFIKEMDSYFAKINEFEERYFGKNNLN